MAIKVEMNSVFKEFNKTKCRYRLAMGSAGSGKSVEFCEFLKSKDIDVEFIQSPGEHTWEFCDKHVKEFIKTLNLK